MASGAESVQQYCRRDWDKMDRWLLKRGQFPQIGDKHTKNQTRASKIPPVL